MTTAFHEDANYEEVRIIQLDLPQHQIRLIGQSIAASRTSIIVPEYGTCFDYGINTLLGTQQELVLITHGHADHVGSLHFHAFERGMHDMNEPTYVMPIVCNEHFQNAYRAYHQLGGARSVHSHRYNLIGVKLDQMGQDIIQTPKGRFRVRPYRMKHSLPTIGYMIVETRKKLKEEYIGTNGQEIAKLIKSGQEVTYPVELKHFAFTGDTTIQGLLTNPEWFQVKVLVMECTYLGLDPEETQSFAKKRSHIHIKDIEDHLDLFQNETIVLCHFSRRYKKQDILDRVEDLNLKFGDRLEVIAFI